MTLLEERLELQHRGNGGEASCPRVMREIADRALHGRVGASHTSGPLDLLVEHAPLDARPHWPVEREAGRRCAAGGIAQRLQLGVGIRLPGWRKGSEPSFVLTAGKGEPAVLETG